jgi:hypothetical protein
MFIVEVMEAVGKPPRRFEASQVVIRMANGTPVSLAALYGSQASVLVSHCEDESFDDNLRKLGITETVITTPLKVIPNG